MKDVLKAMVIVGIIVAFMASCIFVAVYTTFHKREPTPVIEYQLTEEMQELRTSIDALVEKMLEYEQAKKEARGGE